MGTTAARKLRTVVGNVRKVLAIEYMAAAQAIDFGQGALGLGTKKAYDEIRKVIAHLDEDREMYVDMEKADRLIGSGALVL